MCVEWCLGRGSVRKFHRMFSIRPGSGSQRAGKWKPAEAHHRTPTTHCLPSQQKKKKRRKKKITVRVLVYKNDCMFIVCVRSRERERLWMHFLPCKWWKKRASRLVSVYSGATEQVSNMCTACLRACSPFTAIICRCCVIRSKGKQWCVHLASHRMLTSLHNADSNSKQQRPQRFEGTGWAPVRRRRERRWKSWIAVLDKYSISNTMWLVSAKTFPPHIFFFKVWLFTTDSYKVGSIVSSYTQRQSETAYFAKCQTRKQTHSLNILLPNNVVMAMLRVSMPTHPADIAVLPDGNCSTIAQELQCVILH